MSDQLQPQDNPGDLRQIIECLSKTPVWMKQELLGVDLRMFYCQCCPHRPSVVYPELHYPRANCNCCPRPIPVDQANPVGTCPKCKRRDWDNAIAGGSIGLCVGMWLMLLLGYLFR